MNCPKCNYLNAQTSRFCTNCGYVLSPSSHTDGNDTFVIEGPGGTGGRIGTEKGIAWDTRCPACGAEADLRQPYCTICGAKLPGAADTTGVTDVDRGTNVGGGTSPIRRPAPVSNVLIAVSVVSVIVAVAACAFALLRQPSGAGGSLVEHSSYNSKLIDVYVSKDFTKAEGRDDLRFSQNPPSTQETWLITDDVPCRVTMDDDSSMGTVEHNALSSDGDALIACIDAEGSTSYTAANVHVLKGLLKDYSHSDGATVGMDSVSFTTDVKGNKFDWVSLQIIDTGESGSIEEICKQEKVGEVDQYYTHAKASGDYIVRIKVNTNLKDEYVDYPVHLEENHVYRTGFTLDDLGDQKAQASGFNFCG